MPMQSSVQALTATSPDCRIYGKLGFFPAVPCHILLLGRQIRGTIMDLV